MINTLKKISVLQRRVNRIIAGVNRRTNTDIHCENFQILNVKEINMYVICLFMYRFHLHLLPEEFDLCFTLNRNVHAYRHTAVSVITCTPLSL